MDEDKTIARLRPKHIDRHPALRRIVADGGGFSWDLIAWEATAECRSGLLRLVAIMPGPPERVRPRVLCLDGSTHSEHRYSALELCLYYPNDPPERIWTMDQGLIGLFDMARRHVTAEGAWRDDRNRSWPIDEAPHGPTKPALHDPRLRLRPLAERLAA